MTALSIALGGGGAAGIGHIPALEALDELGIRPTSIVGTSMGAMIGAGYAAGLSGSEIRAYVTDLAKNPVRAAAMFWGAGKGQDLSTFASVDPVRIVNAFLPKDVPENLEDLPISFCAVATDFHARSEAHLTRGAVRSAVGASIAIPGVFSPVEREGRFFVDGGVSNNLPFDVLPDDGITVAIDVFSQAPSEAINRPNAMAASLGSMRIMMRALIDAKLKTVSPNIIIQPESRRFGVFDFLKAQAILEAAEPAKEDLKQAIGRLLEER